MTLQIITGCWQASVGVSLLKTNGNVISQIICKSSLTPKFSLKQIPFKERGTIKNIHATKKTLHEFINKQIKLINSIKHSMSVHSSNYFVSLTCVSFTLQKISVYLLDNISKEIGTDKSKKYLNSLTSRGLQKGNTFF